MLVGQLDGWYQPGGAASSPPVLGAQVLGSSCLSGFLFSESSLRGQRALLPVPGTGSPHLRGGQGRGPGRARTQRARAKTPAALPPPWALSRLNLCPRGQAGPKCATALEPGGLAEPIAPLWPGDKAPSKFSPWSKPGRFTGPQVL